MKKAVLIFFALFFAAFAYLNLNDPDPIIWVAAYGITALLFLTAAFGRSQRMVIGSVTTILFVWMCTMIPGMIDWFRLGMPSITGEMKATDIHVEVVREFLGLFIAVVALGTLIFTTPSSK
ncbi:MAG: transmembrane 220 family protein [Flavobacteriales bacterium]